MQTQTIEEQGQQFGTSFERLARIDPAFSKIKNGSQVKLQCRMLTPINEHFAEETEEGLKIHCLAEVKVFVAEAKVPVVLNLGFKLQVKHALLDPEFENFEEDSPRFKNTADTSLFPSSQVSVEELLHFYQEILCLQFIDIEPLYTEFSQYIQKYQDEIISMT